MPGKGIYDWFLVTYRNDDYNFKIKALVGGMKKKNYNNKGCNNYLDATTLNVSELFKNAKQENKKKYDLTTVCVKNVSFHREKCL